MRIVVNGETRDIEAATLAAALEALDYADATVATALNGDSCRRGARRDAAAEWRPDRDPRAAARGVR